MAWEKTGTVSVQTNSGTVTGTGTNFAANSRVGDAFKGPDGAWYEISNVASATVISILPVYKGPTTAGAAYSITPVNGYSKLLTDAANAIIKDWGDTLAGISPFAKTLLDDTSAAIMRQTLELGTASTGAVQTSPLDASAGRILTVGAFGWNGGFATVMGAGTNLNNLTVPSVYACNATYTNGPAGVVEQAYVSVIAHGPGYLKQDMRGITGNSWYSREQVNGVWSAWLPVYTAGNIIGLMTGGAIIERGSNSNGNYTKYADGTMECWIYLGDVSFAVGSSITLSWSYPVSFVGIPFVSAGGAMRAASAIVAGSWQVYATSATGTSIRLNPFSSTVDNARDTMYFAKGRWKA